MQQTNPDKMRRGLPVDAILIGVYFLAGPLFLVAAHLGDTAYLNYSVASWRPILIYGVVSPMIGVVLLLRHARARFAVYIFLSMDILRALIHGNLVALAVGAALLLYLQTRRMRALYPALKSSEIRSRLGRRARTARSMFAKTAEEPRSNESPAQPVHPAPRTSQRTDSDH